MGPPGMPSLGGMLPITGLGAAAALWRTKEGHRSLATKRKKHIQPQTGEQHEKILQLMDFWSSLMATQLFHSKEKIVCRQLGNFFAVKRFVFEEI